MKIFDNINNIVKDDLIQTITKGSKISIASACFSIYAFEELKEQLQDIDDPYTKIDFLVNELNINRQTAGSYLNKLASAGLLKKTKIGKSNFYINTPLFDLFAEGVLPAQDVEPIKTITEL